MTVKVECFCGKSAFVSDNTAAGSWLVWHRRKEHPVKSKTGEKMTRNHILNTARELISGDRAKAYGSARKHFTFVGEQWGLMLGMNPIPPWMVALMLAQLKVSRIIANPGKSDSWVDAAGYTALGGELAPDAIELNDEHA